MSGGMLVPQHDTRFVAAAAVVAVLTSYVALGIAERLGARARGGRGALAVVGALVVGIGTSATHHVAMLGYRLPVRVDHDGWMVVLSIVVAVAAAAIAFCTIAGAPTRPRTIVQAGMATGLAMSCEHYIAMAAMQTGASMRYDPRTVIAASGLAVVAAMGGFWLTFQARSASRSRQAWLAPAALLMGFAIVGMHYLHMTAIDVVSRPELAGADQPGGIGREMMGLLATAAAGAIVLAALGTYAWIRRDRLFVVQSPRISSALLWSCLGLTMLAMAALATLNWQASQAYDRALTTEDATTRALSDARFLDEALTLTARIGATSPAPEWIARYDSLDEAMQQTHERLRPFAAGSASGPFAQLERADRLMATLERSALARASTARPGADSILRSREYMGAKRRFASALRVASDTISAVLDAHRLAARRRAMASMLISVGVMLLLVVAWAGVLVLLRKHLAEERHLAEELRAARDLAEAASRSKGEFLASMSHELRTPLTAVIGFANILHKNKSGRLAPADLEYVARIQRSGRHLLSLINEVLDLARLESRRVELVYERVELRALIQDAVGLSVARAEAKDVALRLDLPAAPQWVETDASKLTQVLINLIGNAMKFTGEGAVTVRLFPEPSEVVRIAVTDTGPGIPAHRLEAIFQPFEQADNTTARRYGGSGLGLAISRSIAIALGGTLRAESTLGAGSTFTLEVPRRVAAPAPMPVETPPPAPVLAPAADGRRLVLVIDDDADARSIIAHQVEEAGAEALLAASGEEGLRLARERRPDAITLDLVMPGLGGVEVLRRLKADPQLSSIPVVIVSVAARDAGSLLGALDAVSKPLEPGALAHALQRQLGAMDRPGIEVLVVEDEPDMRALLVEQLRDAGATTVDTAGDGREALLRLEARTPDLVVLDLVMPEMGGISLLRTMRLDIRWAYLPVIVVTGAALTDREAALLEQEAITVLHKGDDIGDRLGRVLREVIPHGRRPLSESA